MTNLDKLNDIFIDVFDVKESVLDSDFNKDSVNGWDSVRQLTLTSSLEDTFDIMLDPEDIIGCNSYESAKEILRKYEIEF